MPQPADSRVAVYIDFDNIVISRYEQVLGKGAFAKDKVRATSAAKARSDSKLKSAIVDIDAILDYASSFGQVVISRAYADWSVPANAIYQNQLIGRAVDLTQLFPLAASLKNGADIRLSVDVMEDLFRLPDITHVVIVAGDSDYVALAQRCSRLGRSVIGVGVAGSTSRALKTACTQFKNYDEIDGVPAFAAPMATTKAAAPLKVSSAPSPSSTASLSASEEQSRNDRASNLLVKAIKLVGEKDEWHPSTQVKSQMLRLDPAFSEKSLGFTSFTAFIKSRSKLVDLQEQGLNRSLKLIT
jgi:uncharacterized LabA/DUF88 family protein